MTKTMKINKKILFKTTSALTCLMGAVLLFNQTANATTSVGTMSVTASVGNVCTLTASALVFGAYANLGATLNSTSGGVVSTDCSGAISHVLSVTQAQDASDGIYYLALNGGASPILSQRITFKLYTLANAGGTQLSGTVAFATATGSGANVAVATLFGQIQATGNTGKESGSYTKSIALNAVYN